MARRSPELGPAELEVLKALWDAGPGTVRDVLNAMHARGRKLAYTTVLTLLTRLEQKRFVASDKSAVAYIYRAKVSREKIAATRLRTLVQQLYDGAAGPLALQLMESQRFSADELAALQALIERLDDESA